MRTPAEIRTVLEARIAEIDAELKALARKPVEHLGETGGTLSDPLESDSERETRLGTIELLTAVRADVTAALAKLDAGTYGTCSQCGTEISINRLDVLPSAVECVDCAGRHEPARH